MQARPLGSGGMRERGVRAVTSKMSKERDGSGEIGAGAVPGYIRDAVSVPDVAAPLVGATWNGARTRHAEAVGSEPERNARAQSRQDAIGRFT